MTIEGIGDDLTQDYRAAGFNRRLGFGERPAVLIVDMCQAYFAEGSPKPSRRLNPAAR